MYVFIWKYPLYLYNLQNIDLHSLTGWIPERQSLRDKDTDYNGVFDKIRERFHKGHCLATISTGQLSEDEASRAGNVSPY